MKILLYDKIIEPNKFVSDVQVIRYDEQTFDELCEFIRQQIAILNSEPIDFAIVLNDKLAAVFPFFEETIVSDFFKGLNCASISFFGEYIEYFGTLQQELAINVYCTDKKGRLQLVRKRLRNANPPTPNSVLPNKGGPEPKFFVGRFFRGEPLLDPTDPNERVNVDLFNECNSGCPEDKYYFTYPDRAPPCYRLKGDLVIDNTKNYQYFIKLDNGLSFDGCGHTITLTSSVTANNFEGLFGSPDKKAIINGANVSISNVTIKVDTEHVSLSDDDGWLCYYVSTDGASNVCCVIDNCHVCAVLNGYRQGGLFGYGSFYGATDSRFTIQNCSFRGDINGEKCGGIVGRTNFSDNKNTIITIQNCHFIGDISGTDCGGMVSDDSFCYNTNGTTITIQDCCCTGTISGSYNGGITSGNGGGYPSFNGNTDTRITISGCNFTGDISGEFCGGIAGGGNDLYYDDPATRCFSSNTKTSITIQDCSFSGKISGDSNSGIIGAFNFYNNNNNTTITIQCCRVVGDITGNNHGGVVGAHCFNANDKTNITIQECHFTGDISGQFCGGITGGANPNDELDPSFSSNTETAITIQDCSFSGKIYGNDNSGIIGCTSFVGNENTAITIQCCRAVGDITGTHHGGVVGSISFNYNNNNTKIAIQECKFIGEINGEYCGGITGPSFANNTSFGINIDTIITIQNCTSLGNMSGNFNSGIIGAISFVSGDAIITIRNCSFSGDVSGYGSMGNSGIVGPSGISFSGTIEIYNCLVSGNISSSEWGGIVGGECFYGGSSNKIHDCYSFCNFTVHTGQCGGILGPRCGYSSGSPIYINNCYSTGTNLGENINSNPSLASFAIVGLGSENCIVSNCVYNSYYQTTAGPKKINDGNSYYHVIGTPNITGLATCNDPNTVQISYTLYEFPFHIKLSNPESNQKQYKDLNIVATFSVCEPLVVCNIITFVLVNVCRSEQLYIYSKDMKFKSQLYWDNNNLLYNGTLASGTYVIATRKH